MSAVVVLSGGLDSTTLLHFVHQNYTPNIHAISFDYGQRHMKELFYAQWQAQQVGALSHKVVDISNIGAIIGGTSSLTNGEDIPEGHYAEDNMKSTVVPNRNMIMASIAAGYAIAAGANSLWLGVHGGDHFIYPDCRPEFFTALNAAVVLGNEGFSPIPTIEEGTYPIDFVLTPFISMTKNDIAKAAFEMKIDIAKTWSCYKGGDLHCGRCGTCVERLEAIASTGHKDPTEYEDPHYWKTVVGDK